MEGTKRTVFWLVLPMLLEVVALFVIPLLVLFRYSFYPFVPGQGLVTGFVLKNYSKFLFDSYYLEILVRTLWLGFLVAFFALLLGYPLALFLAKSNSRFKTVLLILVVLPLLSSAVIRTYGWMILLGTNGLVNKLLLQLGLVSAPVKFMYTLRGVVVALTEVLLPFMVLTLVPVIRNIDRSLEEAALGLGASKLRTFLTVVFPLSLPGVAAGSIFVFVLAISSFVTPSLMGGPSVRVMSSLVREQAISLLNWPFAAAVSLVLLVVVTTLVALYQRALISAGKWEVPK
ncbi:MAG: ABC transporter permease [Bacillota bacterium]|nr:ABC transporter permease [Bacillota bacterium]